MADYGPVGLLVGRVWEAVGINPASFARTGLSASLKLLCRVLPRPNIGGAFVSGFSDVFRYGVSIDSTGGNPAPSLKVRGSDYPFRLAVKAGARTINVDVLQPVASAVRPKLVVKANPAIGLVGDQTATAGAGTGWQTLSVSFTATANGGVRVLLVNEDTQYPAWFDNVRIV